MAKGETNLLRRLRQAEVTGHRHSSLSSLPSTLWDRIDQSAGAADGSQSMGAVLTSLERLMELLSVADHGAAAETAVKAVIEAISIVVTGKRTSWADSRHLLRCARVFVCGRV